jgi:hypothetical protein
MAAFWAKVSSVPNPGPPPVFPRVNGLVATLSPAAMELRQATSDAKLAGGLLALVGATSRTQSLKKEFETKAADASSRWQNLQNNWGNYTVSKDFQDLLSNLQYLRSQYDSLPQKRLQELQKLEANRYRLQLHAHLDRCRISHARINGVGVAKKDTLQSYSIETAADIVDHRVLAVPGFGPVLLSNLKRWRDQQERRFVFDPNKEVDQAAKNVVERQILAEKIDIERRLNEGLTKLTASSSHILTRRRAVLAQAQQAARDLAQAQADLQAAEQAARELAQTGADLRAAEQAARDRARAEADLRAAEQAARDRAQAEAHPRVAAAVPSTPRPARSPNVNARRINAAIFAFSVITIGGLILALNLGKGPSAVTQQQISRQVQPQQFQPPEASPVPPVQPTLPPRVDERQTSPRPEDQFSIPVPENPFQRGFVDKTEWQQWVAALTGDFRRGAEWWAGRRSLANPGSCKGTGATSQDFAFGCESAKARLTPIDKKRKSDPEYRRGWNSYSGPIKPPSAPDVHGSPVEQSTIDTPRGSETEAADRLNAQELKRLGGR